MVMLADEAHLGSYKFVKIGLLIVMTWIFVPTWISSDHYQ
jgi:hypothetical protein